MSDSAKDNAKNGLAWIDEQLQIVSDRSGVALSRESLANAGEFDSSIFSNIKSGRQKPGTKFFNNVSRGLRALGANNINPAIVAAQFGLGGSLEESIEDDIARFIGNRISKIKDQKVRRNIIRTISDLLDIASATNPDRKTED